MWVFLGGDVEVNSEDEVRPGEVQVHGESHLQGQEKINVMKQSIMTKADVNSCIGYLLQIGTCLVLTMCRLSALLCLIQRS